MGGVAVGAELGDAGGDEFGVDAVFERLDLDAEFAVGVGEVLAQAGRGAAVGAAFVAVVCFELLCELLEAEGAEDGNDGLHWPQRDGGNSSQRRNRWTLGS